MVNPEKKGSHLAYIDALRGLAFLGVLLVHVQAETPEMPARLATAGWFGGMGVALFFLISAFTLMLSFHKHKEEKHPLQNYFIRRVARILPLFWCGVLFYGLLNGTGATVWAPDGISWVQFLTTLTFLHGFYPTTFNSVVPGGWSIAVEMGFYLVLPLLVHRITSLTRALTATFAALLVSLLLTGLLIHFGNPHWLGERHFIFNFYAEYWFPSELPVFLLGIVLFYVLNLPSEQHIQEGESRSVSLLLIGLSLYIIFTTMYSPGSHYLPSVIPFACAFLLLVWGLSLHPWRLIVNPVLSYLGTISFSCYLTHFAVLYRITPLLLSRFPVHQPMVLFVLRYSITLLGTAIFATLTYRLIEIPGISLGRRLIVWNEARASRQNVAVPDPVTPV